MKSLSVLAVASLVTAGGVLTVAVPADAQFVTRCIGQGGAVTVPGDLLVPAGEVCVLDGTTVLGDVRVAAGADLLVAEGTFEGEVVVAADAFLEAVDTAIAGTVTARQAFGTFLEDSSAGAILGRGPADSPIESFVFATGSAIAGAVDVRTGGSYLETTTVGGDVIGRNGSFADVFDSTLSGSLDVRNQREGSVFCDSEVYGDAVFLRNSDILQLGADGPLLDCSGASFWGGDVTISNNAADIFLSNNIVAGDLSGSGNAPAPTGSDNRVRGSVTGQFADLQPTPGSVENDPMMGTMMESIDRGEQLERDIEHRRSGADDAAALEGDAQL